MAVRGAAKLFHIAPLGRAHDDVIHLPFVQQPQRLLPIMGGVDRRDVWLTLALLDVVASPLALVQRLAQHRRKAGEGADATFVVV